MPTEAVFSTEHHASETVFHVQPVPAGGNVFLALASIVWWMFVFGVSTNPILLTMSLVLWVFTFGLAMLGNFLEKKKRVPVSIIANGSGLSVGDQLYPKDDIAELSLSAPKIGQVASSSNLAFAGTGLTGSTFALSATMGAAALQGVQNVRVATEARNNARSFSLMLRKRSHSKPITLVYGLTSQAGEALLNDVIEALR